MASFNSSGIGRREFQGKLEDYGLLRHYGFLSEWADDLTYISHKAPNLLVVGPIGGVDGVYERIGTLSPCDCLGPQRNIQSHHTNNSDGAQVVSHDDPEAVPTKQAVDISVTAKVGGGGSRIDHHGNTKASFWLVFGLLSIVILGATVGGAVGGAAAARKSSGGTVTVSIATRTTVTAHSRFSSSFSMSTPSSAAPIATPSSDCPSTNGTIYTSLFANGKSGTVPSGAGLKFLKLCSVEQYGFNLAEGYFMTFDECIELCASLNFFNKNSNCLGVTFIANGTQPGNCWAHNVTTSVFNSDVSSAVLQE
ncbi:hypothetical protein AOQ84DRAFT_392203 [Glonium stellatum]|uniref:Apple domain-containing protein n=1 Tax=Glonium stellatum TaxID=574774 RepID=A0A8E2ERW7_9PEZI|nr:hypothetical protein AOQ84DRAFT_392203 [Glonium stellatum]